MKICPFWRLLFRKQKQLIIQFLNISAKVYCFWKFDIWVNYCWSYGSSNLLFRFFRCRLGHLDKRQTKKQETRQYIFLKANTKTSFVESFKVFDPTTTKKRSFKFFVKLNKNHILLASFSKLRKYQTLVLIELHCFRKG